MHRRRFLALALALPLLAGGCPQSNTGGGGAENGGGAGGETISIAFAGPLTGAAAALGQASRKGFDLAVELRNASGGVNGKKIVPKTEDDKGDPNEATNVAQKLASDPSVLAVIGHFNSSCSNAAKDTYNRTGVIEFSPGSTSINVCRGAEWTFRNLYHDGYQGIFMARYVREILGHTKAAIAFDNDDYGRGLKDAIVAKAAEIGLEIVAEEAYNRERTQDFKTIATTLQGKAPQTVIVSGLYNEAALLAKAIRNDLGWKDVQLLGSDGVCNPDYVKTGGDGVEGALIITPFHFTADASPEAQAFGAAFRTKYGEDPDTWAALGFDAVNMTLDGIAAAGADRKALKDWFASRKDKATGVKGVTGVTYFDEHGDCPSKPAQVVVVRNGAFALAEKQLAGE
jgi:branched-chain amino acid transport system substrate-binding protein